MNNYKRLILLASALSLGLHNANLQAQQPPAVLQIFSAAYLGTCCAVVSIVNFEHHPKKIVGAWAIASSALLIKLYSNHLKQKAFENRSDRAVLQEAQELLRSINQNKMFMQQIEIAEKITPELSEDQQAVIINKLRKSVLGLGYYLNNYWYTVAKDYNKLHEKSNEMHKRIVKLEFTQPTEAEKISHNEILADLKKTNEEIESTRLRVHKLMSILHGAI